MPLTNYQIIGEGGEATEQQSAQTVPFGVVVDGQTLSPPITTNIEVENDGDVNRTKDQCNNIEVRRFGSNTAWIMRIQGIVTATDRSGVLSLSRLMSLKDRTVRVVSDFPIEGPILVANTTITQSNDNGAKLKTDEMNEPETMFTFNLQLGEEEDTES